MRHIASLRFNSHTVTFRFRKCASSYARAFVPGLPCGHKDRTKVAAYPTPTQRRSKTHYKRVAIRATQSDMRKAFEKGLMVIENFQTPEPARGSGNTRHIASLRFTFHTVNCRFRECASSYARAFVRGLPCGHKDRAKVAAYLRNCVSSELSRRLLRFTKSTPNSPLTVAGRRKDLDMIDELGPFSR